MKKTYILAALASLLASQAFAHDCAQASREKNCGAIAADHGFGKLTLDQKDQFPVPAVASHATQVKAPPYAPDNGFDKLPQDQKDQFPARAVAPHATQPPGSR